MPALIIDTDPGVDDIVAILFALATPGIEILAYVVSYGNTDVEASYVNILKLYHTLDRHFERYPEDRRRFPNFEQRPYIVRGPVGPLEGAVHSAQYFHGRDGLGDITLRHATSINVHPSGAWSYLRVSEQPAPELALELIRTRPAGNVTYVALGPLTNLALMTRAEPETVRERLGRVVSMGGALDVPGNTSPVAEFNFFADPFAVHDLLVENSGLPLDRFLLLPLDVTTPHELSFPTYASKVDTSFHSTQRPSNAEEKSPLHHFTSAFLERTRELMLEFGKDAMELHDIVAVWCAAENPPAKALKERWVVQRRLFQVERYGELTRGMLVVDRRDEGVSKYAPGDNRSEVHASAAVPAQFESQGEMSSHFPPMRGVPCIVETPGPEALLELLLSRIWGVT